MQKFTQKWCLISFLEPIDDGVEFFWKDWPLHVTLAGVFSVDWENTTLKEDLKQLLSNQKQITTTAEDEGLWGENKEYHIVKLKKSPEIATMHNDIVKTLKKSGAIFNEDQFIEDGFIPHSTVQKHARLNTGDTVRISSVTLIDMFPKQDWRQRKVIWTIRLNKS